MIRKARGKINSLICIFCYLPEDSVIVELKMKKRFIRFNVSKEGVYRKSI